MTPGPFQLLLIIVILVLLFGAGKLPRIMEDTAKGIKAFKRGMRDEDDAGDSTKQIEKKVKDTSKGE